MNDLQAIVDRVEIEALRGDFTDAVMMRDYDCVASLFTEEGAVRMPHRSGGRRRRRRFREPFSTPTSSATSSTATGTTPSTHQPRH